VRFFDHNNRYEELSAALKKSRNSHNQLRTSRVRFESQLRNSHNAGSDSDSNSSSSNSSSSGNNSSNAENRKHSRSRSSTNASVVKEGLKREVTRLGGSSSSGRPLKLSRTFQVLTIYDFDELIRTYALTCNMTVTHQSVLMCLHLCRYYHVSAAR
jgi:hypothetical protein